jgi:hypothetical protein
VIMNRATAQGGSKELAKNAVATRRHHESGR